MSDPRELASSAFNMLAMRQLVRVIATMTDDPDALYRVLSDSVKLEIEQWLAEYRAHPKADQDFADEQERWLHYFAEKVFGKPPIT